MSALEAMRQRAETAEARIAQLEAALHVARIELIKIGAISNRESVQIGIHSACQIIETALAPAEPPAKDAL